MSNLLLAAQTLADGLPQHRKTAFEDIKAAILDGEDLSQKNASGLRAIDVIARGMDTFEGAALIEMMAETNFAAEMLKAPFTSDMPPMVMTAYSGNPLMLEKFLELGMPAETQVTAPKHKLLKGTAFHAVVLGYRAIQKDEYTHCMALLMAYNPKGIDVADMLKQRPVDLAIKQTIATNDRTLANAIVAFGASIDNGSGLDAKKLMIELMKRPEHANLNTVISHGAARGTLRLIEQEMDEELISSTVRMRP